MEQTHGYTPQKTIGTGTFGAVFLASDKDGNMFAIKKVVQDPRYKNRELEILQQLNHPNCMKIKDHFQAVEGTPPQVFLYIISDVFPFDLFHYLKIVDGKIHPTLVKVFAYQIFRGLAYLHRNGICHRDIKPTNVLVNPKTGLCQLCDFGSAKPMTGNDESVSYIATRNYRAPELLFNCTTYSYPVDVWAAGCVIAEMLTGGRAFFSAISNADMIDVIAQTIGSPTRAEVLSLHGTEKYEGKIEKRKPLKKLLSKSANPQIVQMLEDVFVYDPAKRATAEECMQHQCFDDIRKEKIVLPDGSPFVLPSE